MTVGARLGLGLAFVALAAPLLHGEDASLRLLFPADRSVLEAGRFEVIGVLPEGATEAPPLRVDGKSAEWLPVAAPVLVARLELSSGAHEIALGSTTLRIYVRGEEPPDDWAAFQSHPGAQDGWKNCAVCHETAEVDGRTTVGDLREPEACRECHSADDFQLAHFHPERPLAGCHQCHALHGSPNESFLKSPIKQLCAKCHD